MAGGITVLLLIIVLLVVGGIALAMYGTGGFRRPRHTRPSAPAQERTDFAGRRAHLHG
jgi:hypothetical protein